MPRTDYKLMLAVLQEEAAYAAAALEGAIAARDTRVETVLVRRLKGLSEAAGVIIEARAKARKPVKRRRKAARS